MLAVGVRQGLAGVDKHVLIDFRLDTHTHFEDGVAYLSDGNV